MSLRPESPLLRWLPADSRRGVVQRMGIVWAVALPIALFQWGSGHKNHSLDASLVYSYAISTAIWFLTDPSRIALHRLLGTQGPHYWELSLRMATYLLAGVVVGYTLGVWVGDAYTGHSTWALLAASPLRFFGFWLSTLGISLGFLFSFYQRARNEDLQRQATEARLKLLETQLEPHMLFNTLANLRALITTDPQRAVHMLDRLNDYLRATLRASRTDGANGTHTLAHEFARLHDYLELMAVRMGPRMTYALYLPDALQHHPVPPLLLQPLVENAIRHGLEPHLEGGRIDVHARIEGARLVLEVIDTGVGMDATTLQASGGGFGLAQVRERLASLPGGGGHVDVNSLSGQGTTVRIQLPLSPTAQP